MAVSIGYLRTNPADRVTLSRVEKKELHQLADEQVKNFLEEASADTYGIILKMVLFTDCGNRRQLASHGTALTLRLERSRYANRFKSGL